MSPNVEAIIDRLATFLDKPAENSKIVMLCGIAGAGKSTLAKEIIKKYPSFHRLSVDQIIYETRGLYGIDFPASEYAEAQVAAMEVLDQQLLRLIRQKKSVVLDRSFWARKDRIKCYELFDQEGVESHILVYLRADKEFLWGRIQERRRRGINADSALDISEELLEQYCHGFQSPDESESPEVVEVKDYHVET